MKAAILAGGLGTRLQPYTTFLPKPMLPLGQKPLLEHLICWAGKNGIKTVVLCVSYMKKTIEDYFEDGGRFGVSIEYAAVDRPLATAGQLKTAERFLDDTFACIYGDSVFDFSLRSMARRHKAKKSFVTMGLHEYRTRIPYGVIDSTDSGRVTAWKEKPEVSANINLGCYIMEPGILEYIPKNRPYGMDSVIRRAIADKKAVNSFVTKGGFVDIGDKASYRKAHQQFVDKLGNI